MLTLPVEQRLSLDVSFLKFKMAVRSSHFETAQHALLEDRRLANHDRCALYANVHVYIHAAWSTTTGAHNTAI